MGTVWNAHNITTRRTEYVSERPTTESIDEHFRLVGVYRCWQLYILFLFTLFHNKKPFVLGARKKKKNIKWNVLVWESERAGDRVSGVWSVKAQGENEMAMENNTKCDKWNRNINTRKNVLGMEPAKMGILQWKEMTERGELETNGQTHERMNGSQMSRFMIVRAIMNARSRWRDFVGQWSVAQ